MLDKDSSLCKSFEVRKNMFVEKIGWRVENEGESVMRSSWRGREGEIVWGLDSGSGAFRFRFLKSNRDLWRVLSKGTSGLDLY